MKTRRSILLPVVAALFAMLLGMAGSVFAQAPQATPVTPSQDLQATIEALQTQLATQEAVEAEEAQPSPTPPADLAMAEQSEVRMLKDGSRPMTPEEIAHDDKLWAPVIERFNETVDWFVLQCSANWPTQPFIAQELADGRSLKDAWTAAYNGDINSLESGWNSFYYEVKPQYSAALEQSVGVPPTLWASWAVDPLPYPWEFATYMDQFYPGCSTGSSAFNW